MEYVELIVGVCSIEDNFVEETDDVMAIEDAIEGVYVADAILHTAQISHSTSGFVVKHHGTARYPPGLRQ